MWSLLHLGMYVLLSLAVVAGFGEHETQSVHTPQVAAAQVIRTSTPLLDEINRVRAQHGRSQLTLEASLQKVANIRVTDMVNQQYYAHRSPDGNLYSDYLADSRVLPSYSCENLQLDSDDSPQKAVQAWLESSDGHRDCLLDERLTYAGLQTATYNAELAGEEIALTHIVVAVFSSER